MTRQPRRPGNRVGPRYEYRILYRRWWWGSLQVRLFQSAPPAERLAEKLLTKRGRHDDLEPIVELFIQRREVGEWTDVQAIDERGLVDVEHRRSRAGVRAKVNGGAA